MQISPAAIQDTPQLCDLLGVLFAQESEFCQNRAAQAEGLRQIIEFPERGQILVLREGGTIVGMVSLLYTISTALGGRVTILEDMVVRPEWRGQGAGSELLQGAIDFARTAGCGRITLLTDGDNEGAQRFYERHGFGPSCMVPMRLTL